jgi:plastocyanin
LTFLLAASLGAAAVVLPAAASSEASPAVEAENKPGGGGYEGSHAWKPSGVTIAAGSAVTFSNPTSIPHGVRWVSSPAPPSCSGGVPVGTGASASGTNWSGTCTFTQAGSYTFYCTVHGAEMTGTITVNPGGTTTTQPTTGGGGPTTTTTAPTTTSGGPGSAPTLGSAAPGGSPLAGGAATAVKLSPLQRGASVRGSVAISATGAGGRLQVDLLAKSASLAGHRASRVRVGRLVRSSLHAGRLPFSVALDARARRALHAHRRLALTVRLVLSPPQGAATSVVRSVVLHV